MQPGGRGEAGERRGDLFCLVLSDFQLQDFRLRTPTQETAPSTTCVMSTERSVGIINLHIVCLLNYQKDRHLNHIHSFILWVKVFTIEMFQT